MAHLAVIGGADAKGEPAAAPALLTRRETWSYAGGEVASNLAWNMVAGFLLLYYTDVAGLPVAALGTLMLATRVADAVFDPAVGLLVDRTRTARGKARPYLLYAAVPFALLTIATFSVPSALSGGGKLVYAYATFTLLGLLYSLLYIPYGALLPLMTQNPGEKLQLGSLRSMGTSLASIFVYGLTMPIVGWVAEGWGRQAGFSVAAVIMSLVTMALYFGVYANCRERYGEAPGHRHARLSTSLAQMVRNPVWRIVFALALLAFLRIGILVSSVAYYAKDVLRAPALISLILPLLSVAIFIGGFIASRWLRHIGKRAGNLIALGVAMVLTLALPLAEHNTMALIAVFALSNVASGIQGATIFVLIADAVEVHQERFGERSEGLLVSSVSFGMKVGMAIGSALTAYVLAWAGYSPAHATSQTVQALRWLFYGAPVALMLLQMLCFTLGRVDPPASGAHASATA